MPGVLLDSEAAVKNKGKGLPLWSLPSRGEIGIKKLIGLHQIVKSEVERDKIG